MAETACGVERVGGGEGFRGWGEGSVRGFEDEEAIAAGLGEAVWCGDGGGGHGIEVAVSEGGFVVEAAVFDVRAEDERDLVGEGVGAGEVEETAV